MSRHVFPPANDDFTRGNSPLVGAVNGLLDPKPDPIASCRAIYRHGSGHFRDDNFGNVMEHFYDITCMTILILS